MSWFTASPRTWSRPFGIFTIGLGVLLLLGAWYVVYVVEGLFAESHLASYYCCLMPEELQRIGPLERGVSDFFRTSPGRDLPGVLLVGVNAGLLVRALRRTPRMTWLPLAFALLDVLYVLTALGLVSISWAISDWAVGPRTSAYKGYHRTWYGIALHLALWAAFLATLVKVGGKAATPRGTAGN